MKKRLLLIILLLTPFMVKAEEKEVKINSVDLVELSDGVTELSKSAYSGLETNLNLRFKEVGDYAKYKVVIENTTDEDYELLNKEIQLGSGYIIYETTYEEDSNIIKSNTTKTLYVNISYVNEIEDDKYTNGKYTESNSIIINLANNEKKKDAIEEIITNPNTGIKLSIIISSLGLISGTIALLVLKKKNKLLVMILMLISITPITILASEKLFIKVNTNIEIAKTYQVKYMTPIGDLLVKEDELKYYELANKDDYHILYIGSVSEENKYYLYNDKNRLIWTDPEKYIEGDLVTLKGMPIKRISGLDVRHNCHVDVDNNYILCNEQIPIREEIIYGDSIIYSSLTMEEYGYEYTDNDIDKMNFTNGTHINKWDDSGYFVVEYPNSFTMLNHDILFERGFSY